jgi:flagellum-specific peptidoglycan hydrolase FlgJ
MTLAEFVNKYGKDAIAATEGTAVFPIMVLAAAAHESGYSKSLLSSKYNNFFGVKKSSDWKGKVVVLPTKEVYNGKTVTVNAEFKHYSSPADSFRDYIKTISRTRYVNAGVMGATTPQAQIAAVKAGGYATDPNYVQKIVNMMAKMLPIMPSLGNETEKKNGL